MSVLLGRNGITPWIEEAAYTAVSTDWRTISESSLNTNKRLFQRPRPAKLVQVVACCWPPTLNNNIPVTQQSSTSTIENQCNRRSSSFFPCLVLHDGLTSVNAILSDMVQSRLFSSMPEEADVEQLQKHLQSQMARKSGSIVRISGWSFSTVDVCLGKRYLPCNEQNPHHQLSWPLALLIEDSVELIGAEGTGQTVDRPRDVNESLRILSVLSTFSHWDLYLRLAMSYSYFQNKLLLPVNHNNYFLPDRRGHLTAPDVLSILEFIPKFHELYRDDSQKRITDINDRPFDDWKEQYDEQFISNRRKNNTQKHRVQLPSIHQCSKEIITNGQSALSRFSYETWNGTRITNRSTKQSVTIEQSSSLHSHGDNSEDTAHNTESQFDTQPENLKWISTAVTSDVHYLKTCSKETEESYREQEFDTQLHHIHQFQSDVVRNDKVLYLDFSSELDTQLPQRSLLNFSKSSCIENLKTCDLTLEEAQLDTQPPISSSLFAAMARKQGGNDRTSHKRKRSVEASSIHPSIKFRINPLQEQMPSLDNIVINKKKDKQENTKR
jgi:hypothetical protein